MELLIRVETKWMTNWLSFFGYYISKLLWYFLFDVLCCYIHRPQEQARRDRSTMRERVDNHCHDSTAAMVVGTSPITSNIKEIEEDHSVCSTYLHTTNSDDSDYDGDDESSIDEDIDNRVTAKQKLKHHVKNSDNDARVERFELASEHWEATTNKPFKPKTKPKKKKKKIKAKAKEHPKQSQVKVKKPKGNETMANQRNVGVVTNDPTYKATWDGGTMSWQHHPVKWAHNEQATADEGSCTTSCVQCCDTD